MPMPNPRQYLTISQQNNTIMLPRRIAIAAQNNNSNVARLNGAFVADNSIEEVNPELKLKLKQYEMKELLDDEDDDGTTKSISASGNIEAETNKLELVDNDEFDKHKSGEDSSASASASASASNSIVRKDHLTIEYNEETEEQKNLNESSVDFVKIEIRNEFEKEDDEMEKNHEFEVTTTMLLPLDLSIATAEDVDYIEDIEKLHEFEAVIDKKITTAEDFDHRVEAAEVSHLNLAINRDRENAESSADEYEHDEEVQVEMSEVFNTEWLDLSKLQHENLAKDNEDSNEIHVPADLSNDIIVNDYAAAHNVPFNVDAEFIDVTSTTLKNSAMPIFENLSMK